MKIFIELIEYIFERKKFFLLPSILILFLLGYLIVLTK